MAPRDGFIIPNANTYAPDFQTAQPDQGDFVILGNSRYGVISGCKVEPGTGNQISIGAGTINVLNFNGTIVPVNSASSLSVDTLSGGSVSRFDLVAYYNGAFSIVKGVGSANPVFPDVLDNMVVLAALYLKPNNTFVVIDKRNFLQPSAVSVDSAQDIVTAHKSIGSGSSLKKKFTIEHDGKLKWSDATNNNDTDASVYRSGVGEITVSNTLKATDISATGSIKLNGYDAVTSQHLKWTSDSSSFTSPVAGDIHVDTDTGLASIYTNGNWSQLSIEPPTGSVIMSFNTNMTGWLKLDGTVYQNTSVQALYDLFPEWRVTSSAGTTFSTSGTWLKLPDMRKRFPLGASANSNIANPTTVTATDGSINFNLDVSQLPSHRHQDIAATNTLSNTSSSTTQTTNSAGEHSHSGITDTYEHTHTFNSNAQHNHFSTQDGGLADPIVTSDFNKEVSPPTGTVPEGYIPKYESSTPSATSIWVRTTENLTSTNITGIVSPTSSNTHAHNVISDGTHTHTISVPLAAHTHPLPAHSAVGSGAAITIAPPSLSIDFYIKK